LSKEQFPDKKRVDISFDEVTAEIKRQQEYSSRVEVAQEEATWFATGEYPHMPVAIVFFTDIHYGNKGVDYDLLEEHIRTVKETPNMFALMGGDLIDAFSPTKNATGMMADAINPDEQAEAVMSMLVDLDHHSKLGGVQIGNHDAWVDLSGYRFERFLQELQCPVFQGAGNINILVGSGGEKYRVYWSHTHWGNSKLNITNAAKRALQFSSPDAEIALLGHVHQSSAEHFDIGSTPGAPGYTIMLWPNEHKKAVFRNPQDAKDYIVNAIRNAEEDGYIDPYTELIQRLNSEEEKKKLRRK